MDRRKRLTALSYEEKVGIVERMHGALPQIRTAADSLACRRSDSPETPSTPIMKTLDQLPIKIEPVRIARFCA